MENRKAKDRKRKWFKMWILVACINMDIIKYDST